MRSFLTVLSHMRNRHYFVFDVVAMLLIPIVALSLRLDVQFNMDRVTAALLIYSLLSLLVKLPIYYRAGMYRHLWRYASIEEVSVILGAIFGAGFVFILSYLFLLPLFPQIPQSIPRSVPFIDLLLSLFAHGGVRLLSRVFTTEMKKRTDTQTNGRRVLIVGAGNSGTMIAKELLRNPAEGLVPIAFIDDDPRKQGVVINGIPVLGGRESLVEVCREFRIELVLIAMPSAPGKAIRTLLQIIEPLRLPVKTLPGVAELMSDTVQLRQFREVRIDDLLRREPVRTDMTHVRSSLEGEVVLVTGAGGSIGSELCRHIAQSRPRRLILLGHGENSIHAIQRELQQTHASLPLHAVIADVRDGERIRQIFATLAPTFVYHAAAHKHVPLMEDNLVEAITNNVLGTMVLLEAAMETGVRNVIAISTDKAVRPTSVMGMSKRMAEISLQLAAAETGAHYVAVRFGNVLGSRGSVIPIFLQQIAAGGPVTVTHPEMRRFFMTIPEAVQLVLQASMLDGSGQIYVLDMGEPERILDLAIDVIQLSGLTPYKQIDIEFTGLRPGEKLNEELFRENEVYARSRHEKIFTVIEQHPDVRSAGLSATSNHQFSSLSEFRHFLSQDVLSLDHADRPQMLARIAEAIPECDIEEQAIQQRLSPVRQTV